MAEVFQYINAMYCIRDDDFNPIHDTHIIETNDVTNQVNKVLLAKAFDDGNTNALVFQNELFFTRDIADTNNNELKYFLGTNATWDVLIFNPRSDLPLEAVPGFSRIHRVTRTDFIIDKVYLVSRRFMQKVKDNNYTDIQTYYYSNNFVDSLESKNNKFIVGKLTNIQILRNGELKYHWTPYSLS